MLNWYVVVLRYAVNVLVTYLVLAHLEQFPLYERELCKRWKKRGECYCAPQVFFVGPKVVLTRVFIHWPVTVVFECCLLKGTLLCAMEPCRGRNETSQ